MKKWYKSKTINLNAAFIAIVSLLRALGIHLEPEVVAAIQTFGNIILRLVTDQPIGSSKPGP